ncbi:MAG: type II toxin-antitoxin system PemK/MazF family toxin [Ignavibacteriaceae bacterium]
MRILRGDIVWANFEQANGVSNLSRRPVLILSHTVFNETSGTVIAVAVTEKEQKAGFPLTFELNSKDFPQKMWVRISQARTLSVDRIGEKISHIKEDELATIIEGFNEIIGG